MDATTTATPTTSSKGFNLIVLIISGVFVAFSVVNIIYYNRIKAAGGASAPGKATVTAGDANVMMILNIILLIISIILFVWSLWKLLFTQEARAKIATSVVNYGSTPSGFFNPGATTTPVVIAPATQ